MALSMDHTAVDLSVEGMGLVMVRAVVDLLAVVAVADMPREAALGPTLRVHRVHPVSVLWSC